MIRREKPIAAECPRAQASIGGYMLVVRSIRGLPTTAATPLLLTVLSACVHIQHLQIKIRNDSHLQLRPVSVNANRKDHVREIERDIRWGRLPDRPDILYQYLLDCEADAMALENSVAKDLFRQLVDLLVEVICDVCVPYHWRCLCLDNIYRPMACLRKRAGTPIERLELSRKTHEINVLAGYFLIR